MTACMGGFCRSREKCADYRATGSREPVERRCPPGEEYPEPLQRTEPVPSLRQLIDEATA